MNIDELNAIRIKALEMQVAAANADANKWCKRATELADVVDDKDYGIKLLTDRVEHLENIRDNYNFIVEGREAQTTRLLDKIDRMSDEIDLWMTRQAYEKARANRLEIVVNQINDNLAEMIDDNRLACNEGIHRLDFLSHED